MNHKTGKLEYPVHIRMYNILIKKIANIYWTTIDILSNNFFVFSNYFYQKTIKEQYDNEHQILNLTNSDNILHIGCGVFPYSAILLSEKKNNSIVTIDNNQQAIQYAQKVIQNRNLDKKIKVKLGDGSTYDLTSFSVIISSSCVDSSLSVLENIITHAKSNSRIIIRELPPMSTYLKDIIEKQKTIVLEHHYKYNSYPFNNILRWESFVLRKLDE